MIDQNDNNNKRERSTKETESWYKDFVDHATDLVQSVDSEGRFIYVNQAWFSTLKYTAEEVENITLFDIIHPDSMEHCMAVYDHVLTGQGHGKVEAVFVAKDGTPVMVEGNVNVKLDENGRFVQTRGIFRNTTERKRAVEELKLSEERAKKQRAAITELVLDESIVKGETAAALNKIAAVTAKALDVERSSIWILDESGEELRCLSLYEAKTSTISSGAVLQAKKIPRYFAAIKEESRIYAENAWEDLRTSELTEYYLKPLGIASMLDAGIIVDGVIRGVISLEHVDTPRLWQADEEAFASTVSSIVAQLFIADERTNLLETLKQSEAKYRLLTENVTDVVWTVDHSGKLTYVSPAIEKLLGYTSEEIIGTSMSEYLIGEDYDVLVERITKGLVKKPAERSPSALIQACLKNKNNNQVFVEFHTSWIIDQEDNIIGVQGSTRDITKRRQTEEKIRYLSFHDQLTGLHNRHFLEEEMKRLDTERQLPISIIMADLNGLKLVNDTYGHQIGDEMLKRAAKILKTVFRDDDLVARFGGDEFVLYLPRTPEAEARKISGRIEKACHKEKVNDVPLSLSTGVAVKVSAEQQLTNLFKAAEDSLYQNKLTESRSGKSAIVNTLLKTLAAKSFETEIHTRNMQEAAHRIGEQLGLPDSELRRLNLLITLHDIGKINIPEELLNKKEALTASEWVIMKKHCETGYRIARATDDFAHVADDILAHHECWDGSGYPRGLKGDKIPLLARITAIADAYEVMNYGRPYKQALSRNEIVAEFKNCSGTHFDPELVEIFLTLLEADL